MPGQFHQSALWAVHIRVTARRSDELAHNTFASSPDRGDVCIMQGRNPRVNGFVVKILKHYMLSDKSAKAIIQTPCRRPGQVESAS